MKFNGEMFLSAALGCLVALFVFKLVSPMIPIGKGGSLDEELDEELDMN
jgi:hypothetical protein